MLIGLHGPKRSGKDEGYRVIKDHLAGEWEVTRKSFADPLKVSAAKAIGWTLGDGVDYCDRLKRDGTKITIQLSPHEKPRTITGREYLQWYGTEAHRELMGDNFWTDQLFPLDLLGREHSNDLTKQKKIHVVTDVRFPNEARRIQALGGYIVFIDRPAKDDDAHASEQGLPMSLVDTHIVNDGTLEEYQAKLKNFIDGLLEEKQAQIDKGALFLS